MLFYSKVIFSLIFIDDAYHLELIMINGFLAGQKLAKTGVFH
jgi:hypothetical protein